MRLALAFLLVSCCLRAEEFQELASRASAAREANNVAAAIGLYGKALDANPKWEEGWWFLGTLLYDSDQYAQSRDAFQHLVALNTKAAPGWAFLGLCEFETGDYSSALQHIDRALSLGAEKDG